MEEPASVAAQAEQRVAPRVGRGAERLHQVREARERCAPFDADFGGRHDKDGDFEELWAFVFPAARSWGGTLGAVPRENDPEPVLRAFLAKEWCAAKGRGANAVAQWCY